MSSTRRLATTACAGAVPSVVISMGALNARQAASPVIIDKDDIRRKPCSVPFMTLRGRNPRRRSFLDIAR
jgi:hypothetical protein